MSLDNIVAVLSANVANGCSIPELCKDFKESFGFDLLDLCKDAGFHTVVSYLRSRPGEFQVSKDDRWSLVPGAFPHLKENEDRILRSTKNAGKSRGGRGGPPPRRPNNRSRGGFGGVQSKYGTAFGSVRDNYDNGGRVSPRTTTTTRRAELGNGSSSRGDRNNDYHDYPSSYNSNPSRDRGYDDDGYDRFSDTRDYDDQRSYSKDSHEDYDDVGRRADGSGGKEDYRNRNSYRNCDRDDKWQAGESNRSGYYSARDDDRYNRYSDTRDYDDHHSQHSGRSDRAEGWKEDEYGQTRSNKDGRDRRNGDDYAYERGDRNYRFDTLSDRDRSKNFGYVNAADARPSSRNDESRTEKDKAEKELWNIFHPGEEMLREIRAGRDKENAKDDRAAGPSAASTLPVAEASIKSPPASVRSSQPSEAALDLRQAPAERMTEMSLAGEKLGKELTAIEAQDTEARQSMLSNSHIKTICTETADAFVSSNRKFLFIEEVLELTYFMVEEVCKVFEIEYTGKQFTRMLRKMCILHLAIYFPNYFLYNPYEKTLIISNAGLRDLPSSPERAARLSPHPNDQHFEQFFTNLPPGLSAARAAVPPPPGLVQGLSPPPGLSRSRTSNTTNPSKPPGLPFGKLKFAK